MFAASVACHPQYWDLATEQDAEEDQAAFLANVLIDEDPSPAAPRLLTRRQSRREAKKALRAAREATPEGVLRRQRTDAHRANRRKKLLDGGGGTETQWITIPESKEGESDPASTGSSERIVILFYKYCELVEVEVVCRWQTELCTRLRLNVLARPVILFGHSLYGCRAVCGSG